MPVAYPPAANTSAMVTSSLASSDRPMIVCHTPVRDEYRPAIRADRVGEHVGSTWKFVRRSASGCSASRLGVRITGLP